MQGRLYERDRETRLAEELIERETGGVLFLEGPAGAGKSTLIEHALAVADRHGHTPLTAKGGELERSFAYGVARQLFEHEVSVRNPADRQRLLAGAARHSRSIVDASFTGELIDDAGAIFHGLHWLTVNMSAERSVLICVDDAHWSDDATLSWLAYLARRIEAVPVKLIVAARPLSTGPPATSLETLRNLDGVRPVTLAPLGDTAVERLAEDTLGAPVDPVFAGACRRATGGNPFFVRELLRTLRADGVRGTRADVGRIDGITTSALTQSVVARLTRTSELTRALAEAAAILDSHAQLGLVAALAGVDADAAAEAADGLVASGLLTDSRTCAFTHPIVRTAIEQSLDGGRRSRLHRHAARILAANGRPTGVVASHLLECLPEGDPEVVEQLRLAAADARSTGSPATAVAYLERALTEPPPPALRPTVLVELGLAMNLAVHPEAVARLREAVAGAISDEERAVAGQALCEALAFTGDMEAVFEQSQSLAAAPPDDVSEPALEIHVFAVGSLPLLGRTAEAVQRADAVLASAPSTSSAARSIRGILAFTAAVGGRPRDDVLADVEGALVDGRLVITRSEQFARTLPALVWTWMERPDEAVRLLDDALQQAQELGAQRMAAHLLVFRGAALLRAGRPALAGEELAEAQSLAIEDGFTALAAVGVQAEVLLEAGQAGEAEALVAAVALPPALKRAPLIASAQHVRALALSELGRHEEAITVWEDLSASLVPSGAISPAVAPWRSCLGLALAAMGEERRGIELAEEELELARSAGLPGAAGVALRALGQLASGSTSIALHTQAVRELVDSKRRLEHARAELELGAALRRSGQRVAAREHLVAALKSAQELRAAAVERRAWEELRAAGARPRRQALAGPAALTASELRVARLAAAGRTNAEVAQALFVTRKTVEKHLSNAYAKLGIASRQELTAILPIAEQDAA